MNVPKPYAEPYPKREAKALALITDGLEKGENAFSLENLNITIQEGRKMARSFEKAGWTAMLVSGYSLYPHSIRIHR